MDVLGFLSERHNAPTEKAKKVLPNDIHGPPQEVADKTIILFHDESIFQLNEDQPTPWAEKGTSVMQPKSKGSGIMVIVIPVLGTETVTFGNVQNYFRKVRHDMFAYLEGLPSGNELEKLVKNYKQVIISHRTSELITLLILIIGTLCIWF